MRVIVAVQKTPGLLKKPGGFILGQWLKPQVDFAG